MSFSLFFPSHLISTFTNITIDAEMPIADRTTLIALSLLAMGAMHCLSVKYNWQISGISARYIKNAT